MIILCTTKLYRFMRYLFIYFFLTSVFVRKEKLFSGSEDL